MEEGWKDREIEKVKWLLNEKLKGFERHSVTEYLKSLEKEEKNENSI